MPHLKIFVAIKALIFLQMLQTELCLGSVALSKEGGGGGGEVPTDRSIRARAPADTESWLNERYPDLMTPLKSVIQPDDTMSQCSLTKSGQLCRFGSNSRAALALSSVWRGFSDRAICCETKSAYAAYTSSRNINGWYIVALPDRVQVFQIGYCGLSGDCRGWGKRCQVQQRPHQFLMSRFPVTQPWQLWWAATTGQLHFRTLWVDSYCKCMGLYRPYRETALDVIAPSPLAPSPLAPFAPSPLRP
ncbi:hypothetical protein CAPTEDRAFT_194741 [Capitella teleta]|uniref:Uncharacterized protein n=1 Tax=Capitella teleta TaxID=283909 RepID=R7VBQ2_CAPTE|nr:hypothetical protein CAPTEDRAFT_194741 [Capitella teleta]|eukprot:ELU16253.1 hypothetical protein CAPTEDRAFT_194741 [Capitella teleta]